jgi:hypothetical protein
MSRAIVSLVVFCTFFTSNAGSTKQAESVPLVGEGVILAIRKGTRQIVKPEAKSIDTPVELWIVRVDTWGSNVPRSDKYILLQYSLRERGLSDDVINRPRLRFTLRDRREDEHTDCLGTILVVDKKPYTTRRVELSDYERTVPGKYEAIPPIETLPCFIAEHPPVVIE